MSFNPYSEMMEEIIRSHLWLLITADLDQNPVNYNLGNKLKNWSFLSGFQKVFLFELKTLEVFELNILD